MSLRPLLLLATAALALSACGKRGDLDRPKPLWERANADEPVAVSRDKPATPETVDSSIRKSPVETGKPDPIGSPGDSMPR
jgi:predicted small lipoprotein YifL